MKLNFFCCIVIVYVCAINMCLAAETSQVREVARLNNCPPKKIEVFQQSLGEDAKVVYRVDCNLPKATGTKDKDTKTPEAMLVNCEGGLCNLLRPYMPEKK